MAHDSQDRQYAASTGSAQQSCRSTLPKPLLLLLLPDSLQLLFKRMRHKLTLEAPQDSLRGCGTIDFQTANRWQGMYSTRIMTLLLRTVQRQTEIERLSTFIACKSHLMSSASSMLIESDIRVAISGQPKAKLDNAAGGFAAES
jgi:hypothetical protein